MNVQPNELQEKRETLGLSREQLARELKTTYTTVYRWENGDRAIPPYLELAISMLEQRHAQKAAR